MSYVIESSAYFDSEAKGHGKADSARVITGNAIVAQGEGRIAFLLIYDKADASSVKMNVVKAIAREMGF